MEFVNDLYDIMQVNNGNSYTNIKGVNYPDDALAFFKKDVAGINDYIWFLSPYDDCFESEVADYSTVYSDLKTAFDEDAVEGFVPEENEGYPFSFCPDESGLVPWAQCDCGTVFYFRNDNGTTKIVVYGDSYEFYEYTMSVTEFLYNVRMNYG